MKDTEFDVVIVGGGPAGLTSAIYTCRNNLSTLIIEKGLLGGYLHYLSEIENYPGCDKISGPQLAQNMADQAKRHGAQSVVAEAKGVRLADGKYTIQTNNDNILSKAIIIATGSKPAKMGIPGEQEFFGRGVSYCATCDGPLYKGKTVLIAGGGNSAITEAIHIANYAEKVYVVEIQEQLTADLILQERAKSNTKIEFRLPYSIVQIQGNDRVTGVITKNLKTNQSEEIDIDGVFVSVGRTPQSEPFTNLVRCNERGFIITDRDMATSQDGIFAAGDIRAGSIMQISTAVGDGTIAGISASEYILMKPIRNK
ncbi:MAG: thioredoxin-disulfide reductase [Candidatus Coatesbacteria bacterium]|nr:MAG: thioredoxin-disulfide reductase [Candidatus Coatesbacteria bacterium]